MQIVPVSIINHSNSKQVKLPNFGHHMARPESYHDASIEGIVRYIAEKLYRELGKEACDEYMKEYEKFLSKKLDLTGLVNKFLPKFKECGSENVLYEILNKLYAPLRSDGSKDFSQIEITVEAWPNTRHNIPRYYTNKLSNGKISTNYITNGYYDVEMAYGHINSFCEAIENKFKMQVETECTEKLDKLNTPEKVASRYIDDNWKHLLNGK